MKKVLAIVVLLGIIASAGSVYAAGSAQINVSASVNSICKFSAASANLAFGVLNPDPAAANVPGSITIQFWCTKGMAAPGFAILGYTLTTIRQMSGTGGNTDKLDYSIDALTPDANPNAGPASPRTLTISGTAYVAGASGYNNIAGDNYSDSVTLTVTP